MDWKVELVDSFCREPQTTPSGKEKETTWWPQLDSFAHISVSSKYSLCWQKNLVSMHHSDIACQVWVLCFCCVRSAWSVLCNWRWSCECECGPAHWVPGGQGLWFLPPEECKLHTCIFGEESLFVKICSYNMKVQFIHLDSPWGFRGIPEVVTWPVVFYCGNWLNSLCMPNLHCWECGTFASSRRMKIAIKISLSEKLDAYICFMLVVFSQEQFAESCIYILLNKAINLRS